ncbi:Uma2 family endonuclease [Planktothrix mougeotii]|uniref:Uma2 family endonuclease n=1 Tax=Planktothrix mougeotii LEGE 06226 TaxID=1828728 RepID=A0ABR9U6L1_9CYAN|nr:Uma2 family endonuclease [Planktothrix mougeotii]MBE9142101.1 Uma2 family endonuclease [Planktothrix mougeotii LEGE 06226]
MVTTANLSSPPTQDELPYSDGVPMESQRHVQQMTLLILTLQPWLNARTDGYAGGNMFVYFSLEQLKNRDFRGPDFFAVVGVPKGERKSWVVWEEGKAPDVVIELLSESTANTDKTDKKLIYQNQLRVSEYFWYDPFNPDDWAGFFLQQGIYQPLILNENQQFISQSLGLSLVRWSGIYQGTEGVWLRWATLDGELLPLGEEIAEQERQNAKQERQRAEQERIRAEQERQRAEQAESQLRQVALNLLQNGMSIDQVVQITGLSQEQIQ